MDKEKQIMELARELCSEGEYYQDCFHCPTLRCCGTQKFARELYDKGWCKASDVAREIFEEIEKWRPITKLVIKDIGEFDFDKYGEKFYWVSEAKLAELKKKYTESEKDK